MYTGALTHTYKYIMYILTTRCKLHNNEWALNTITLTAVLSANLLHLLLCWHSIWVLTWAAQCRGGFSCWKNLQERERLWCIRGPHVCAFFVYCRSQTKVKFSSDQVRPALGSGSWLIGWWMGGLLTMLKNLKTVLFQTFSTWHRILSAFTAL